MSNLIYQKIAAVMAEDLYIKRGSAGQGTGVLYDEVISVLKPLLVKHGIVVMVDFIADTSRANAKGNYIYEGLFDVHYICAEDGSKHTSKIVAHSMDMGDKAPGKAITYAAKISHVKVFGFETGVNDESRAEQRDVDIISPEQAAELFGLMCDQQGNFTDRGARVAKAFNVVNINEVKSSKFSQIIRKLK